MRTDKVVDTYVDTLGIRCVCDSKYQRDSLFNTLIGFLMEKNMVGIKYDKDRSNEYYQVTKLLKGNTKLATVAKGYFKNDNNKYNPDYYYININFYGLKRYNKTKDEVSMFLVRSITAFLNTYNIDFIITELDIAMDIESKIDSILAVCINRSPNVEYYQLGDTDGNGEVIQQNKGTYYMEKYQSHIKKMYAMIRAYLYDKRFKEMTKYHKDIGFDLTRFEVKLQKRFFVKNEFGFTSIYKALKKYAVLEFEDIKQKEQLIQKLNSATTSKQRKKNIDDAVENTKAVLLTQRMSLVSRFLREIDTIKFNLKGEFVYTKHEDYLECMSKFNRR